MQARCGGRPTDFSYPDAREREDTSDDAHFYAAPRLVGHVDACAAAILREEHRAQDTRRRACARPDEQRRLSPPGDRGLEIDGLGLNHEELDANRCCTGASSTTSTRTRQYRPATAATGPWSAASRGST